MKTKLPAGFTLIEMLVVIAIIATIAAFAVPALTSAMAKGQMTGTMNNARQLYLAGYQMALDGGTNSDGNRAWPGDYATGICDTLQQYLQGKRQRPFNDDLRCEFQLYVQHRSHGHEYPLWR